MALLTALALTGSALQTIGRFQSQQNQVDLTGIQQREIAFQKKTSANLFNITFPELKKQQRAGRGQLATEIASGGVDVGSGSALAQLSEQARTDDINTQLTKFQQQLNQRSLDVETELSKRTKKQLKRGQKQGLLAGGINLGNIFFGSQG